MALIYPELSRRILGIAMQLHRELGCGFKEKVYQDAFEVLLQENNIPYEREKLIHIFYKGKPIKTYYQADFVCFGDLIVEMKTVETIADIHRSQLIHYLKATKIKKGLLINFKNKSLQYERFANDY